MRVRKKKRFAFTLEGREICNVMADYEQAKAFEVMIRRFCRYGSRFGYNIRYSSENVEQKTPIGFFDKEE